MNNLNTLLNYLKKKDTLEDKLNKLFDGEFKDTYFSKDKCVEKLIRDYKEHGNIIVAFDFDDTVNKSKPEYDCSGVINLLQICSELQFTMICYTARTLTKDLDEVKEVLNKLDIRCDYINDDCLQIKEEWEFEQPHKIFYNIFLDDRAGLKSSYKILKEFIEWLVENDIKEV